MTSRTHTPEDIKKIDDEFKEVLSTKFFKEKKEWVGLTDEEYQEILTSHNNGGLLLFYNLVEEKLREKNSE